MKKFLLYGHGGAYNHGAEAILRTTIPLLRKAGIPILLSTHFPEQDCVFGIDKIVDRLLPADLSLVPEEKAAQCFEEKELAAARIYRDTLAEVDEDTICVGIGGDNYCYPNWHRQSVFHHAAKERGGRSVLWGCSIQPEQIDGRMAEILKEHDSIYARESISGNALRNKGIENITILPDPAFLLNPQPTPLPHGLEGDVAAINVSPLCLRQSETLLNCFVETAALLLKKADTLLLIPHVTMPTDDDRDALTWLARQLPPHALARICWAPSGLNAVQLKYLISKCSLLVCCRTHAAIAGYSTSVPTLAVGYSIKSYGIAADLGMERWVVPCTEGSRLPSAAADLWEARESIQAKLRTHYQRILEMYSQFMQKEAQ